MREQARALADMTTFSAAQATVGRAEDELAAWLVLGAIRRPGTVSAFVTETRTYAEDLRRPGVAVLLLWVALLDAAERSSVPMLSHCFPSSISFLGGGRVLVFCRDEIHKLRGLRIAHVAIDQNLCEQANPVVLPAILDCGGEARLVGIDGRMLPFVEVRT